MRTFYIGVYAMSYSTFSVLVTAERTQQKGEEKPI